MIPQLERYAARAFSLLHSHWRILESHFAFEETLMAFQIAGHAELIDGSTLYIRETVTAEAQALQKTGYAYQFRHEGDAGFSRYDSASHGRPAPYHHKHTNTGSIRPRREPPTLIEMMNEVEQALAKEWSL
jgi:hypothetical protein